MSRAQATRRRPHPALACALRLLISFALAFTGMYGAQTALAAEAEAGSAQVAAMTAQAEGDGTAADDGATGSGSTDTGPAPGDPAPAPQPEPEPTPTPQPALDDDPAPQPQPGPSTNPTVYITDLGLYVKPASAGERIEVLAYATADVPEHMLTITENGGSIDFDAMAFWNDGSTDNDWSHVSWKLEPGGEEFASITRDTGLLKAQGGKDGTVVVVATLETGYTQDGAEMSARIPVDIKGQQDVPYVTDIRVCDDAGQVIDPSYTFHDITLATAVLELQATVTVHDPKTNQDAVYQVKPGSGLSSQTGGQIADLTWYSAEGQFGVVSEDGIYRPLREATNVVYAISDATLDGSALAASAVIIMPGEGEAHPQESLTVRVMWEALPDHVVAERTFSVGDMEALGTHTVTFTAFGGVFGFMTFTGRGPYLAEVLKAAGVDTQGGVKELYIQSFDNPYVISWDLLVDKNRYYFPNMDIGSEAEAVQVAPMIAIDSMRAPLGSSDPVADAELTSDDRFRLLFGAGMGEEGFTTTSMQRYWIHTIDVILTGAPPVEDDRKDPDPEPEHEHEPTPSLVPGGGDAGGGGAAAGTPLPSSGAGATQQDSDSRNDDNGQGRHNAGAWSVLQAVNNNRSVVEGLDFENPFGPFTGAFGFGCLVAGGLEAFVRFRWQLRVPAFASQE